MDEDDNDAAGADAEQAERRRREDEGLERCRQLSAQAKIESEEFEKACERFRRFMLEREQERYRRNQW